MICSFCNNDVLAGTGIIHVKRDGSTLSFCSRKCRSNLLKLKREGRLQKWTSKALITMTGKAAATAEKKKSELSEGIDKIIAEKRAKEAEKKAAAEKK